MKFLVTIIRDAIVSIT